MPCRLLLGLLLLIVVVVLVVVGWSPIYDARLTPPRFSLLLLTWNQFIMDTAT